MMLRRSLVSVLVPVLLLLATSLPVAARQPPTSSLVPVSSQTLPDGTRVVLSKVISDTSGVVPMSAGTWQAGCNMTGYGGGGNRIWTYTVWQIFSSNGSYITYFPDPTKSADGWLGWVLTSGPDPTHWWISWPYTAAARGSYTFTWFDIYGHSLSSHSGWVEVDIDFHGTWSCLGE